MAVVLRLARTGKKGERRFRVVAVEKRSRRDGKPIEFLGWYQKPDRKELNKERINYWISQGAQPSPRVAELIK